MIHIIHFVLYVVNILIGNNCENEEMTRFKYIFAKLEIFNLDVPNEKIDRFTQLKNRALEKATDAEITIKDEENSIKENYVTLSVLSSEILPIKNYSDLNLSCNKCSSSSEFQLIIPKYDFNQIEDPKTKQRIAKNIHYYPILYCSKCGLPMCSICKKVAHPNSQCDDKNLCNILNIKKIFDLLEPCSRRKKRKI